MQRTDNSYEVIGTRNRLVTLVVILITLAIINSLASEFPRSGEHLVGSFFIENLIKTITLVIMLVLVRPLRHSLAVLIRYYMRRSLKVYEYADRAKMGSNINVLSRGVANIAAIAITWIFVVQLVNQLLLIEGGESLNWFIIVLYFSFSLLLIYYLVIIFRPLLAILDMAGKVSQAPLCPKCGSSTSPTSTFCIICGTDLNLSRTRVSPTLRCPSCGMENMQGSEYCEDCGTVLLDTQPDMPEG